MTFFRLFSLLFCLIGPRQSCQAQFQIYDPNPFAHQYFIGPTAFAQAPQKRHFQVFEGVLAQHQHVQPNGRTVVWGAVPHLAHTGQSPLWWMVQNRYPKYARRGPVLNWGFMGLAYRESASSAGAVALPYTSISFGNKNHNLCLGGALGAQVGKSDPAPEASSSIRRSPWVWTVHGMVRLGLRSCLLTENYIAMRRNEAGALSMSGVRFWGRRWAVDLGVLVAPVSAALLGTDTATRQWGVLPWVALHWRRKDRDLAKLGLE
jgi:hypothetical protein